ncbi:MAG: hypothetical protein ABIY55_23330, partial [Kofleriaceae bacterium]
MLNRLLTLVLLAGCSVSSVTFTPLGFDGGVGAADTQATDTQAPDTGVPEDLQAPITVTKAGRGTVTSQPAGIDCGATCARPFRDGTSVTLTAAPSAGFVFAGWSGACTGPTCTIDVAGSAGIDVTATFSPMPTITVTLAGDAPGAVDSSPPGILCPGACSAQFPPGVAVVLTPRVGAAPSAFAGWSIAACPGAGPCTLTPTDDTAIAATFTKHGSATFTASGSFTVPPGVTAIHVLAVGGGGGGANGHQAGGGSGLVATATTPINPGAVVAVTVGGGGLGAVERDNGDNQVAGNTPGSASSFGAILSAAGGQTPPMAFSPGGSGGSGGGGGCNPGLVGGAGGTGGSAGGDCSILGGAGQGSFVAALTSFSVHAVTAGPGGAGGTSSHAGGGGGGGVFLDGAGPGGANGAVPASGKGGGGYGGGGGAGGYDG